MSVKIPPGALSMIGALTGMTQDQMAGLLEEVSSWSAELRICLGVLRSMPDHLVELTAELRELRELVASLKGER